MNGWLYISNYGRHTVYDYGSHTVYDYGSQNVYDYGKHTVYDVISFVVDIFKCFDCEKIPKCLYTKYLWYCNL